MKPTLLAWCDFLVPTGFGVVSKNLFEDLHEHFDVSIVGINYYGNTKYDTSKYFVYPVQKEDPLGVKTLLRTAQKEQPDIIFLFQDIFNISVYIEQLKELSPKSKIVIYFPLDGTPFVLKWMNALKIADVIITYTDWAVNVIKDAIPNIDKPIYKLYHGVDTNVFKPLPINTIAEIRKNLNWTNKFVIINVNRFQPRKGIPITLRAVSMFMKGYSRCSKCGNIQPIHIKNCDLNMCEDRYLEKFPDDKKDTYLYLHMMPQEMVMGDGFTNSLVNYAINAGFTEKDYGNIFGINGRNIYEGEISETQLNRYYNAANINISTTIGEGFGLSLIESQAAGIRSIAPNNSAIPEVLGDTGHIIPNITTWFPQRDNAYTRPIVDAFKVTLALEEEYKKWKESGLDKEIDINCIQHVNNKFLWKDKKELLTKLFLEVLNG